MFPLFLHLHCETAWCDNVVVGCRLAVKRGYVWLSCPFRHFHTVTLGKLFTNCIPFSGFPPLLVWCFCHEIV